ncbi:MAG: hypothetical protein WC663_06140 [Patescibacteria group bacterium]|jgi:uncharacterized membrane protein YjdF
MNIIILWFVRIAFASLACFELANLFGILHFELEFSWFGLALTSIVVWIALEFVLWYCKKKFNYTIPSFVFLFPLGNVLIDAFGDIFKWYGRFSWYDQMAHFLGGASVAGLIFFILCAVLKRRRVEFKKYLIGSYAFFAACFLGVLYEIEEYSESFFLSNNRLGDRFDTPNDLLMNTCGALIGVLLVYLYVKMTDTLSKTEERK